MYFQGSPVVFGGIVRGIARRTEDINPLWVPILLQKIMQGGILNFQRLNVLEVKLIAFVKDQLAEAAEGGLIENGALFVFFDDFLDFL